MTLRVELIISPCGCRGRPSAFTAQVDVFLFDSSLQRAQRERERALIGVAARSCLQLYHSQSSTFLSRNEVHIMTPQGKGAPALSSGSGGAITLSGYVFMSAKDNTKNFQVTSSPLRLLAKGCAGVVKNRERERTYRVRLWAICVRPTGRYRERPGDFRGDDRPVRYQRTIDRQANQRPNPIHWPVAETRQQLIAGQRRRSDELRWATNTTSHLQYRNDDVIWGKFEINSTLSNRYGKKVWASAGCCKKKTR